MIFYSEKRKHEDRRENMRKSGLRDMKKRNRQLIMRTILEYGSLSRIEIAGKTELSPSTVSGLVSELLAEGLLKESDVKISTAGRSRTELTINGDYGSVVVVEIGRRGVYMNCFDMALQNQESFRLTETLEEGNELLSLISDGISRILKEGDNRGTLAGIGLLFQEDMRPSDFNVVYSTGVSSASISLRESLITQYRVPVEEEYSQAYTITHALGKKDDEMERNSAHIAIGVNVVASVTVEGKTLPLREGFCTDLEPFLGSPASGKMNSDIIGHMIALLCILFPLDEVFLSGSGVDDKLARQLMFQLKKQLTGLRVPGIRKLDQKDMSQATGVLAEKVRESVLFA